jgi:hypothetical protein
MVCRRLRRRCAESSPAHRDAFPSSSWSASFVRAILSSRRSKAVCTFWLGSKPGNKVVSSISRSPKVLINLSTCATSFRGCGPTSSRSISLESSSILLPTTRSRCSRRRSARLTISAITPLHQREMSYPNTRSARGETFAAAKSLQDSSYALSHFRLQERRIADRMSEGEP